MWDAARTLRLHSGARAGADVRILPTSRTGAMPGTGHVSAEDRPSPRSDPLLNMPSESARTPRRVAYVAGGLVASLLVLYFTLTSGAFLKAVVLPKVSDAVGATVTAEDLSLSPFSGIELTRLKVTPAGAAPLAAIERVRVRYDLRAILGGTIDVSEVTIEKPVLTLEQQADGSMNLPKTSAKAADATPRPATASKPPQLRIRNVVVKDGSFRMTSRVASGGQQQFEVGGLQVTVDQVVNGAPTGMNLEAEVALGLPDGATLQGQISGKPSVTLGADLMPQAIAADVRAGISKASGSLRDTQGFAANLSIDSSATELRQLKVAFEQSGQPLGSVRLSGPFDPAKGEARIAYQVAGIDRRVLKIAAPTLPFDLGRTSLRADGRIDLQQQGQVVVSEGRLAVSELSVASPDGRKTPELQVSADYQVSVLQAEQTARIQTLALNVIQAGRPLVSGSLDQPMALSWAKAGKGLPDSTFRLAIRRLQTADWAALAGTNLPSAVVSADLSLKATRDGRDLQATLQTALDDVSLTLGNRSLRDLQLRLQTDATLAEFKELVVRSLDLDLQASGHGLLRLKASAAHHTERNESRAEFDAEAELPALLAIFPAEGLRVSSGTLRVTGKADAKPGATNLTTDLVLAGVSGGLGQTALQDQTAAVGLSARISGHVLEVQKLQLLAKTGASEGGRFDATGRYDLAQGTGEFGFQTTDLNERAIGPFVAAALTPKRLVSVSLDAKGTASLLPKGDLALQTDLALGRLVVDDPSGAVPKTPFAVGLNLDVARKASVIDLKTLRLDLGKTPLANNQLVIQGSLDLGTNTAASTAANHVSIRSDGLDLTPLYNLLAGGFPTHHAPAPSAASSAPKTSSAEASGGVEPAPLTLPIRQLAVELDIAKVLLREIQVADWKTRLNLKGSEVVIDPLSLTVNQAPITGKVTANLGVAGYSYDNRLRIDRLPLEPFVASFLPERKGQIHGTLLAQADLRGAGVTGASLGSNLAGGLTFTATNLNLKLADTRTPLIRTVINVVTALPRLIQNPGAQVGSWLNQLAGGPAGGAKTASWVDDLEAQPLDVIDLAAAVGHGDVTLQRARVQSAALRIDARGGLRFAPILSNSPVQIPVSIALSRKIAEKAVLLDASPPADAAYAPLPDFLTVRGTLGNPSASTDKLALTALGAKTLGRAAAGLGGNLGGKVAGAAGVLGTLLGAPPAAQAPTNAPVPANRTNAAPAGKTNPVAPAGTAAPAAPAASAAPANPLKQLLSTNAPAKAIEGLLRGFGKPKN